MCPQRILTAHEDEAAMCDAVPSRCCPANSCRLVLRGCTYASRKSSATFSVNASGVPALPVSARAASTFYFCSFVRLPTGLAAVPSVRVALLLVASVGPCHAPPALSTLSPTGGSAAPAGTFAHLYSASRSTHPPRRLAWFRSATPWASRGAQPFSQTRVFPG